MKVSQNARTIGSLLLGLAFSSAVGLQAQTTLPTWLRVTSGVNTNAKGVLMRTYQMEGFDNSAQLALVEREMAGGFGPNIANLDDTTYPYDAANGYFTVTVPFNFRHDAGTEPDTGSFIGPDYPDAPIPGLPGTTFSSEQAASEAIAFIEFPTAGLFEMGVGSDDCFKLTAWHNPRDRFALNLGQFNGERGIAETRVMLVRITEPGIYPIRCLWANRLGATGWEWYVFDAAGNRVLINAATNTLAIAYSQGPMRPYVVSVSPDIGSSGASPVAQVVVQLKDEGLQVDPASVVLTVNGGTTAGSTSVTRDQGLTTVIFAPATTLNLGATNTAQLIYADNGTPPVSVTNSWSFAVTSVLVGGGAAVPISQVDTNVLGFRVFTHQLLGTDFNNGAALANIRDQLEGLLGPNYADLSQADANGYFYLTATAPGSTAVVNFNDFYEPAEKGNFTSANGFPDIQFPGTPGTGGLDWNADDLATETLTYLHLPTAGGYTLGIKSWDSFAVTIGDDQGRSPKDLFATVLGEYDGDAPDNYLFSFYAPQAGVYPVVLVHNIGIKQGDLEWFSVDQTGSRNTLINAPGGLKGYARGPALPAYVRKVSPGANIAGIQNRVTTGVAPDAVISAEIVDDGTTVQAGNTSLRLNGAGQSTATKSGKVTTVTFNGAGNLAVGSRNVATLVYRDSAGKSFTNSWTFEVVEAFILDAAMSYPPGSGDRQKPGFAVKVAQLPIGFVGGENGSVTLSEAMLAGVFLDGVNVANQDDPTYPHEDGWFQVATTVNFGSGVGSITPDDAMPGIPGTTGLISHYAAEIRTYVEFPAAGVYQMSVYSDDSPRLFQAEAQDYHFGAVEIVSPKSAAGTRIAMCATRPSIGSGFGADLPTTPNHLTLVAADPILGNAALNNAAAVAGNACLLQRGAVAFGIKSANAVAAGATAVIIFNNSDGDRADRPPIFMGGTAAGVNIPCLFIGYRDGTNLLSLLASGPVVVNLQENPRPCALVPNDGYYGGWDFSVYVPQPGLYPFRLVTGQGGGDYGIEWTFTKAGTKVLINDPNDPESLKAFRAVTQRPRMLVPQVQAGDANPVDVNWRGSGILYEAPAVTGPFTVSKDQSMPHKDGQAAQKFFKVQQMK